VDDAPEWLADKLAIAATGGTVKRRVYYTTNTLADFPIRANLALTSRTPNFQRPDVAERLLPVKTQRFEQFEPEANLLDDVINRRDLLLTAILVDVQRALRELHSQEHETYRTAFRMADFANFALKIAPVVSTRETVRTILQRFSQQQVEFANEDDPLCDYIDMWLNSEEHVNVDREITITQLGSELSALSKQPWALPWDPREPRSFGQYFRGRRELLNEMFEMAERTGHGGKGMVSFRRRKR
jgi:hypothetical protein